MADVASRFASGSWAFTPEVVDVFDQHVEQSVPYYGAFQSLVAEATDWLAPAGRLVADLGASTGTTATAIQTRHPERRLRFVLYDEQQSMLDVASRKLEGTLAEGEQSDAVRRFRFVRQQLETGPLRHEDAAVTLALFTLQFLPVAARAGALRWARLASADDGALLVAEKVRLKDSRWAEIAAESSWDYKQQQGIDAESVRAKARALRGVLIPLRAEDTENAIAAAGWEHPVVLFRWHQWALWGAFAAPVDKDEMLAEMLGAGCTAPPLPDQ